MIASLTLPLLLQVAAREPIYVPPPPPPPKGGQLECSLTDENGKSSKVLGELGFAVDEGDGNLYPKVRFESDSVPELTGLYSARWESSNGRFLRLDRDADFFVTVNFAGPTYRSGKGAVTIEILFRSTREQKYLAGLCSTSFSLQGGKTF
jgi:hypothetical protein